jgi:hypothetical protein
MSRGKAASQKTNPAIGKRVISLATSQPPGVLPAGQRGKIADVERHGSNPWIRYSVDFDDGVTMFGLIVGQDIKLDTGDAA